MYSIAKINFKADTRPTQSIFNNSSRRQQPAQIPYRDDNLDMIKIEKELQKKQNKKERLDKLMAYGTCTIGGALALQVLFSIYVYAKTRKGGGEATKNLKIAWENIAKKENFPKLEDDCVNEKVRKFIKNIKDTAGLGDDICKRAGVDSPEQCIIMWGPSGTGKTFSAKMLAKELRLHPLLQKRL